jgi:hypothetical protein
MYGDEEHEGTHPARGKDAGAQGDDEYGDEDLYGEESDLNDRDAQLQAIQYYQRHKKFPQM